VMSTDWKKRKVEDEGLQTEEQVSQLVALWTQDQLVKVLSRLGSENKSVYDAIVQENLNDPKLRKIFVRNLPMSLTDVVFREHFAKYGSLTEAVIIVDKANATKRFGFVTYATVDAANTCLTEPTQVIDGRTVYVNLAANKDGPALGGVATGAVGRRDDSDVTMRKLFVWSLSYETSSQQLLTFFTKFGEVTEAVVLKNTPQGTSKGYGFVTMATQDSAVRALAEPVKQMSGRSIHVKLAAANDGKHSGMASQGGALLSVPDYGQYQQQYQYPGMMDMAAYQQYPYPGTADPNYAAYQGWS